MFRGLGPNLVGVAPSRYGMIAVFIWFEFLMPDAEGLVGGVRNLLSTLSVTTGENVTRA